MISQPFLLYARTNPPIGFLFIISVFISFSSFFSTTAAESGRKNCADMVCGIYIIHTMCVCYIWCCCHCCHIWFGSRPMARQHNRIDVRRMCVVGSTSFSEKKIFFFQFSEYLLVSAKAAKCVYVSLFTFLYESNWTRASRYGKNERRRIEFISCISLIWFLSHFDWIFVNCNCFFIGSTSTSIFAYVEHRFSLSHRIHSRFPFSHGAFFIGFGFSHTFQFLPRSKLWIA